MVARFTGRVLDAVGGAVIAVLISSFITISWLAIPVLALPPSAIMPVCVIAAISATVVCSTVTRRFWTRGTFDPLPFIARRWRALVVLAGCLLGAFIVLAVVYGIFGPSQDVPPGQPQIIHGNYYANNHGVLAPLSQSEYRNAVRTGSMEFLSISILLGVAALWSMGWLGKRIAARGHK